MANPIPVPSVALTDTKSLIVPQWYEYFKSFSAAVNDLQSSFNGDGITPNDTILANAFSALGGKSGTIVFPAGVFIFSSQAVLTLAAGQSIALIGAGQYLSTLKWPNAAGGMVINYNGPTCGAEVTDLCFLTSQAAGGDGLKLNQAGTLLGRFNLSTVARCTFQGDDLQTTNAHYWTNGINDLGVSGVNVEDCIVYGSAGLLGNGAVFAGIASGAQYSIVDNVSGCSFFQTAVGVRMGSYMQGLTVEQTTFTNGAVGIDTPAGAGGTLAQLAVTDCEFDVTDDQIQLNTQVTALLCSDNLLFVKTNKSGIAGLATNVTLKGNQYTTLSAPAGVGINLTMSFFSIVGEVFNGIKMCIDILPTSATGTIGLNTCQSGSVVATTAIKVEGSGVAITGNTINGFGTGINLTVASALCNQQSNLITNCTTAHVDAGAGNTVGGGSP